ncbi:Proliferation Marker Protein Ki-67 [Manis pentadactyla]|nr:Proliferation Marker Protein Ki-67 [Manis pentadactyla]
MRRRSGLFCVSFNFRRASRYSHAYFLLANFRFTACCVAADYNSQHAERLDSHRASALQLDYASQKAEGRGPAGLRPSCRDNRSRLRSAAGREAD